MQTYIHTHTCTHTNNNNKGRHITREVGAGPQLRVGSSLHIWEDVGRERKIGGTATHIPLTSPKDRERQHYSHSVHQSSNPWLQLILSPFSFRYLVAKEH